MKKILVMIVAMIMLLGTTMAVAAGSTYSDLKTTNWAYESVKAMSDKGIIKGYPDGSFRPQNTLTYGEFIKLLVVSKGYDVPDAEKGKHWAYNYYQKAIELNYFPYSKIHPGMLDQKIPREMMAYIISQALGDIEIPHYDSFKSEITDMKEGDQFIYPIVKVYSTGILNGYPDGSFKQKESLTRAETAKVLESFIKVLNGEVIEKYTANQAVALGKAEASIVESFLQKELTNISGINNNYQYYGVDSAQELKELYPVIYYSILRPNNDPLFSNLIANQEELNSPFNDETRTYAIVDMEDIGIAKIEKAKNKYNCEYLIITPKYQKTERMESVLIKGAKIVCNLTGMKSSKDTNIAYVVPTEYYNGAWQNTKLIDFDYIAFYEFTGASTVFLVKKPF